MSKFSIWFHGLYPVRLAYLKFAGRDPSFIGGGKPQDSDFKEHLGGQQRYAHFVEGIDEERRGRISFHSDPVMNYEMPPDDYSREVVPTVWARKGDLDIIEGMRGQRRFTPPYRPENAA